VSHCFEVYEARQLLHQWSLLHWIRSANSPYGRALREPPWRGKAWRDLGRAFDYWQGRVRQVALSFEFLTVVFFPYHRLNYCRHPDYCYRLHSYTILTVGWVSYLLCELNHR